MSSSTSAILYAATVAIPNIPSARPDDATTTLKAHHKKGGGFQNPWDSFRDLTGPQMGMEMIKKKCRGEMKTPDTTPPTVEVRKPEFLPTRETTKLRSTWLGHACFYVEFPGGLRVLFDPVFEDRCSPISFLGPKRYTPKPCDISDIPFIDAVVISHNHYDHLSYPTTQDIKKHHPNAHFFVPLGNKKWFLDSGITNVTELDWWDETDLTLSPSPSSSPSEKRSSITSSTSTTPSHSSPSNITARISCLPSQHFSARSLFDRNNTLWASWSVCSGPPSSQPSSIYFAGDTGYRSVIPPSDPKLPPETSSTYNDYIHSSLTTLPTNPSFQKIGSLRGPFDLGLIPIGAYSPRELMSPIHCNPQDAVRIFLDTRCRRAVGMHWGTWVLTMEEVLEPKRKLKKALEEVGIDCESVEYPDGNGIEIEKKDEPSFGVTAIGQSIDFETGIGGQTKTV
ncbi:putative zn-dependent hydrolase oxidoreductase family [Phaeomoniella chlamydospora]|uniref:Putative zn-dependent hydrolase oxidoreductase family n=1 Tax=Phaeomoniella chlamydospora TaxID=158046 RepID=A0A0G2GLD0_PHACM|nr:putative zn-dependent hydrolase oxidoreductase family [Phaeomoniella chlamydospora]